MTVIGTRPEGTHDEREAAKNVREMFTRIAPRYDFLNHLLSFSLDHIWRRGTAEKFLPTLRRPEARILDLCCGTGDLAFALDRLRSSTLRAGTLHGTKGTIYSVPIVGSDFVEPMLTRAREKAIASRRTTAFATADALNLPYANATFDLVTTAFGFRNLANYGDGLREIARILKPGGALGILEFSEPRSGPLAGPLRFYFREILPRIGGAISGDSDAYAYLPSSVARFPSPSELASLMESTGFRNVEMTAWNFGTVMLHSARRA